MVTLNNLDILNTAIIRPPLTYVQYLRVTDINRYCNYNCSYCFHKFEYKNQDKYSKRIQNGEVEKYYRFKKYFNFNVLYGSAWETLHTDELVRRLDDFLSKNQDIDKVLINTNGSRPDVQLDLLARHPNLYIERSYREKDGDRCHNNKDIIDGHPRLKNVLLIDSSEKLSKVKKLSNQYIKFIYRKDSDKEYVGSVLHKDISEHPELINTEPYNMGFENFPSCINLLYMTRSAECDFSYLAKLKLNNYNRIKTIAEYYDFLIYNYFTNTIPLGSVDDRIAYSVNNNLMLNILRNHPTAGSLVEQQMKYQAELIKLNSLEIFNGKEELDLLVNINYMDEHDLLYHYAQLFECKLDDISVVNIMNFKFKTKYAILKIPDIFMAKYPIIVIGKSSDIKLLMENPFTYNPRGDFSKKIFSYVRYKCL